MSSIVFHCPAVLKQKVHVTAMSLIRFSCGSFLQVILIPLSFPKVCCLNQMNYPTKSHSFSLEIKCIFFVFEFRLSTVDFTSNMCLPCDIEKSCLIEEVYGDWIAWWAGVKVCQSSTSAAVYLSNLSSTCLPLWPNWGSLASVNNNNLNVEPKSNLQSAHFETNAWCYTQRSLNIPGRAERCPWFHWA